MLSSFQVAGWRPTKIAGRGTTVLSVNAQPTALARLRGFVLSPTQFLPVALAQLGALWLIVVTGAAVRLTDSGLGCRHWPGCEKGHPLPAKNGHAYIEFGNRLFGAVTIAVALLAWLAARRTPALSRRLVQLSLVIFLGTLLQAPIGLLAVASDLRWPIVMLHLLLSIALLAGATVLALEVRSVQVGRVEPLVPLELRRLGLAFAAACFVLIVSGSLATAAGPHSGGGKAQDIDRLGRLQSVVYVHAVVVGILPWGLVLVHVFLAATVWIGTVALATLFWRPNVDLADR